MTILITDARRIAGTPSTSDSPSLRLLAWAALKSLRGQTVCQHRLQATSAAKGGDA